MRRQHRRRGRAPAARLQQRLQLRIGGDGVQRVGIEHQRPRASTAPAGSTARTASPPPQPQATAIAARSSESQAPQHQVGLRGVQRPAPGIEQADEHPAGAGVQRGAAASSAAPAMPGAPPITATSP